MLLDEKESRYRTLEKNYEQIQTTWIEAEKDRKRVVKEWDIEVQAIRVHA